MQTLGCKRLSIRQEDGMWCAHLIDETGTDKPFLLGSLSCLVLDSTPEMRELFIDVMKWASESYLKATGAEFYAWGESMNEEKH